MVKKPIESALKVITDNFTVNQNHSRIINNIQDLHNEAFTIQDPRGTRQLSSQKLFQALWRTAGRMKPLDFIIHGDYSKRDVKFPEVMQQMVTSGVGTIMDKGGYDSALRDKNGAFYNLLLYGDNLIHTGVNEDKKSKIPIEFSNTTLKNVSTDNYCTGIRMASKGKSCRKMVIVYSYSKTEFDALYPDNKAEEGSIQRGKDYKDQTRTTNQETQKQEEIEVAYSWDLDTKTFVVFAGRTNEEIELYEGETYPFMKDGEPYIPVSQFICIPSNEGLWNYGIGHLLYQLAIVSRRLMNMEIKHINNNVLPIELVSVAQGQATNFFNRLAIANDAIANGKRGYVPIERSANDPGGSAITAQSMVTQNLFNEWQAVYDRLDQEIRRLGINIDELDVSATKTATEIRYKEENANAFVKQIMEWNASETQFLVELTMDCITEFIKSSNKEPLNIKTKLNIGNGVEASGLTYGGLKEEIKKGHYWVEVNARSGTIPSNAMLMERYNLALSRVQPGSAAHVKLIDKINKLEGIDIPGSEFLIQQAGPAGSIKPQEPTPTQTDRLTINPRAERQTAVL